MLAAADQAGDVAEANHARNVAAWAAHTSRRDTGAVRHEVRLGRDLDTHPCLRTAVTDGRVNLDQADTILHALRELDRACPDLPADLRTQALTHLIDAAATLGPRHLRILGRRILHVINPGLADDYERRRLEDEEAHARRATYLRFRRNGDGTTDITGRLADATALLLQRILHAYTNPRRDHHHTADANSQDGQDGQDGQDASAPAPGGSPDDRRPHDTKLGHALGAFLEHADPHRMPIHGGDLTRTVVTIDHDVLTGRLDGVGLVGDEPITPAHARRLACTAGILPAVLDGDSVVLDLGRTQRLFTPAARRAHAIKHPHCQATGCDIPSEWCEAHHRQPWSTGGPTNLDQLVLLCSCHHHRAHDPRIHTTYATDGTVTYHRKT